MSASVEVPAASPANLWLVIAWSHVKRSAPCTVTISSASSTSARPASNSRPSRAGEP